MESNREERKMSDHTFVTLTPKQLASHEAKVDRWTQTLVKQARFDGDSETRDNARLLLDNRGIAWRLSEEWSKR